MAEPLLISELISRTAQPGCVRWIGIRPVRKRELMPLETVTITMSGLDGDHRDKPGKRAVTLIQQEHLAVIASILGRDAVLPGELRRNIVVSGINLLGLRNRQFQIGDVRLQGTDVCAPCSRMETEFGHGGYAAVRGHGGICATVIETGDISIGDKVTQVDIPKDPAA